MKSVLSKRIFNHSIQQVYEAYSDPALLCKWWGPHGFTNRFTEFAFEEGGLWDFMMIDEIGKEYHNQIVFKEITPEKNIKARHVSAPVFDIDITFIPISDAQTEVQFQMIFEEEKVFTSLKDFVTEKNEENFDRLGVVLG